MSNRGGPRHHTKSMDKKCLMCDDQVREARRLHEKEDKTARQLAKIYNVSETYMVRVLAYTLRANVF